MFLKTVLTSDIIPKNDHPMDVLKKEVLMSGKPYFALNCVIFFFWLYMPLICCSAQVPALPKTIGYLDSQQVLVLEGNKTYTKEQICRALYRDQDIIVSISPTASLENHLKLLKSKIRLGYLNAGFFEPQVDVSYVPQPEHILVKIAEGPRYTKGELVIEGASDMLRQELSSCLGKMDASVKDAGEISRIMKSIANGKLDAAMTLDVYMALLWGSSDSPSFAPSFETTASRTLNSLLRLLGYYNSRFSLKLLPDHPNRKAALHITFQDEGVRPCIGTFAISGNKLNSNDAIISFLGLKTGQLLNDIIVQNAQNQLTSSGRFRFVNVTADINTNDPAKSVLSIALQENKLAPPLDQTLTEKEALMQKVGQFIDRYQAWEKDVCIRMDLRHMPDSNDFLRQRYGISAPLLEAVYSSKKGIIWREMTGPSQVLNAVVLGPEHISYVCPPLQRYIIAEGIEGTLTVQFNIVPNPQREDKWWVNVGLGISTDSKEPCTFAYQPIIGIHPGCWFDLANNPENLITFKDDVQALIKKPGYEITVNRQSGELIEIQVDYPPAAIVFREGAFDEAFQKINADIKQHDDTLTTTHSTGGLIANLVLPLYLTHIPRELFTSEQKIQAISAWRNIFSGFSDCTAVAGDTQTTLQDAFPLPLEEQLASDGMAPMLMSMLYQACHDNLPQNAWLRTLLHASVLMVTGHAQCSSVAEELKQLYSSDQIGPVGYLLTAQWLRQLGYPAYRAFAYRGLQVLSADGFRKDWKPLLTTDSKIKNAVCCRLEKLQSCKSEDIQMASSILRPELALLLEAAAQKLKETDIENLAESLDSVLTDFWDKSFKEKTRQALNKIIGPQA